ncbi:MAG: sugar isomerase [Candidatus Thorarchaeota archaeon SMTZ1-83]
MKPILLYGVYEKKEQTSWRPWGGIQSEADADSEIKKIKDELLELQNEADFPLRIQPLSKTKTVEDIENLDINADAILVYAAGVQEIDSIEPLEQLLTYDMPIIFFLRKDYLWYEIIHPRFLRKSVSDENLQPVIVEDIIVDDYKELLQKLRSLVGLKSAISAKVISIGAPGGWGIGQEAVQKAKDTWDFQIETISYQELANRIEVLKANPNAIEAAQKDAENYLSNNEVELKTDKSFVINAFLLERVFKDLLKEEDACILTIAGCMSIIMPISETTACLPICLLNDSGYLAFCESDFVAIPAGILLHYISSKPVFFVDPTLPHKGQVTVAHCTAPRRMDGLNLERVEILTHFESDYGAAPQVKMKKGQVVTVIDPSFKGNEWIGFRGRITDNPTLQICRTQLDIEIEGDWEKLLHEMKGFHWLVVYGDYLIEIEYALKKVGVKWTNLSKSN